MPKFALNCEKPELLIRARQLAEEMTTGGYKNGDIAGGLLAAALEIAIAEMGIIRALGMFNDILGDVTTHWLQTIGDKSSAELDQESTDVH